MESSIENKNLEIGNESIKALNITRKWTMFQAVLGFIGIGLFLIIGLATGIFLSIFNGGNSSMVIPEWIVFIAVVLIAAIYFFPVLFLFRFSTHTSSAIRNNDGKELHKAFKSLKAYYVYSGVLIIIILVAYAAILITTGISVDFLKYPG